jgi:predicted nicotinamide N-methyase
MTELVLDKLRQRPHTEGFKCGEAVEEIEGMRSVIFYLNLPGPTGQKLEFICREPSCGALEGEEEAAVLTDDDYTVDPHFFDEGYSMAGKTGFKVWTGSRLLVETLIWPHSNDCERLREIQNILRKGAKVVELGAGVGVVGTYLAASGSQVLITDLPTLVENAIDDNLERNKDITLDDNDNANNCNSCPKWLRPHGFKLGRGWVNSSAIDWAHPLEDQLTEEQSTCVDFIVASDVVFLKEMLNYLFDTVAALFESSIASSPSFILSFQRRDAKDGEESKAFTTVNGILQAVQDRGWKLDCLAWRHITMSKETHEGIVKDQSEVFVFEIKPCS